MVLPPKNYFGVRGWPDFCGLFKPKPPSHWAPRKTKTFAYELTSLTHYIGSRNPAKHSNTKQPAAATPQPARHSRPAQNTSNLSSLITKVNEESLESQGDNPLPPFKASNERVAVTTGPQPAPLTQQEYVSQSEAGTPFSLWHPETHVYLSNKLKPSTHASRNRSITYSSAPCGLTTVLQRRRCPSETALPVVTRTEGIQKSRSKTRCQPGHRVGT